jgi:hypothetical protein
VVKQLKNEPLMNNPHEFEQAGEIRITGAAGSLFADNLSAVLSGPLNTLKNAK